MNLHKIYIGAIVGLLMLTAVAGVSWSQHVRDDAKRDAVLDVQKSDIAQLEKKIADSAAAAQAQIAALEKQKQTIVTAPAQAPTIIREVLPNLQQTAPITKESLPDAPSATLSKQNEIDLAQFIVGCKQCTVERNQLQNEVTDQQQVIDRQKTELAASLRAAKGGSVFQRTKRVLKWGAIFAGVGYALGRAGR